MKHTLLLIAALFVAPLTRLQAADRPNILWLVCEDSNVNWFGCYGNSEARTPNIDAFAKQSFRYTHAFASTPVCAPSRSTWITGINALSMSTLPMRSRYSIPHDLIKYYPDYLRKAGYYTSNHVKTDYNIGGRPDVECWDSNVIHGWENRKPGQPFFQVINFMESHESRAQGDVTGTRHSPGDVTLRQYHPDEMGIRMNYAKYYDAVENMDVQVGKALQALDKAGLADDTIVIFNSDHGGVMPGSKRFLFDGGLHAPLIIRIPEKFKTLRPRAPRWTGSSAFSTCQRPGSASRARKSPPSCRGASFSDPTRSLNHITSSASASAWMNASDNERSVRDKRFAYIKNYMPYVIWGQHLEYMWKLVAMRTWEDAYKHHRTNEVTGRFFTQKPVEELYDMDADPDNVTNLADKPEYRQTLETMRAKLREWQLKIHDSALLPEAERAHRATENKMTIYEMVRDPKLYDLPAYLDASDAALAKNPANKARFIQFLHSKDSGLRYWGTAGLLMLGPADAEARIALETVLDDPCGEVSAMAAWVLIQSGDAASTAKAQKALAGLLRRHTPATLMILNILDWSHMDIAPYITAIDSLNPVGDAMVGEEQRMVQYLRESHGLPVPVATQKASETQKKQDTVKDM